MELGQANSGCVYVGLCVCMWACVCVHACLSVLVFMVMGRTRIMEQGWASGVNAHLCATGQQLHEADTQNGPAGCGLCKPCSVEWQPVELHAKPGAGLEEAHLLSQGSKGHQRPDPSGQGGLKSAPQGDQAGIW